MAKSLLLRSSRERAKGSGKIGNSLMSIFKINEKNLQEIREISIDLEKDLQKIVENNLLSVFGLKFISSEFSLRGFRIDTLGFDEETNSFVIIEYKKDRSFSVIDQGYAYLALMLNNKADFILEFNEKLNKNLKREDVDWSQSKVIFLANSFTSYQQNAINFKDLPIELWEAKKFDNGTILFNELKSPNSNESIKTVSKNKTIEKVSHEVKKYAISDLIRTDWEDMNNLFEILRAKILLIGSGIEEKITQKYVGYKVENSNICSLHIQKLKIYIDLSHVEKKDLNDPENKIQNVEWKKFEWGKMCRIEILHENEVEYVLFLIKQVYDKFYSKGVK